jgi:large subunit ribosomal protein L6
MSRIGKLPIEITKGVKLDFSDTVLTVQGPNGKLSRKIMPCVSLDISETAVTVTRNDENTSTRAAHGLTRTLINNMVVGVTTGFQRNLEINGVGYRAEVKGKELVLSLGYSHPVNFEIPEGIAIEVDKMTKVAVKGYDKEMVGQTAAKIRSFRPPEPYKGKGIKYADETILRKAGKTGKK